MKAAVKGHGPEELSEAREGFPVEVSSKEWAFSDWEPIWSQPGSVYRCCKGTGFMLKPSLGGKLLVWHA